MIKASEGDTLKTVFYGVNIDFYLENFKYYTPNEYMDLVNSDGTSNGLEQFYYQRLKNKLDSIHIDYKNNEETYFSNSRTNVFSMVEYLTVIPVKNQEKFTVFSLFSNKLDDRLNIMVIKKDEKIIKESSYKIRTNGWVYLPCDFESGGIYKIENIVLDENNNVLKSYIKTFTNLEEISINGYINLKK